MKSIFLITILLFISCTSETEQAQEFTIISSPEEVARIGEMYVYEIETNENSNFYLRVSKPEWLNWNSEKMLLSGLPSREDIGNHMIRLSDQSGNIKQEFEIHITDTFFPMKIGYKWVYNRMGYNETYIVDCIDTNRVENKVYFKFKRTENGRDPFYYFYRIDGNKLYTIREKNVDVTKEYLYANFSMDKGGSYTFWTPQSNIWGDMVATCSDRTDSTIFIHHVIPNTADGYYSNEYKMGVGIISDYGSWENWDLVQFKE